MDSGCRILVADDTPAIHHIFREVAARACMPVTLLEASDGHACMELLNRNDVQLAFIDQYMPGLSGVEIVWNARRAGLKTFIKVRNTPGTWGQFARRLTNAGVGIEFWYLASDTRIVVGVDDHDRAIRAIQILGG